MTGPLHGPAIDWTRYAGEIASGVRRPSGWLVALTALVSLVLWAGLAVSELPVSRPGTWLLAAFAMLATAVTIRMGLRWRRGAREP